jgi:hypothetical protein
VRVFSEAAASALPSIEGMTAQCAPVVSGLQLGDAIASDHCGYIHLRAAVEREVHVKLAAALRRRVPRLNPSGFDRDSRIG